MHLETVAPPVELRPCEERDLPSLEWDADLAAHRRIFRETFDRHRRGDVVMLVAELEGDVVGQAWVDLERHADEQVGYLWAVRVRPELQGRRVGTSLIRAAEDEIRRRGWRRAEISVEKDNEAARRLYERLGYEVVGDLQETWTFTAPSGDVVEHPLDEWVLRRALPSP